MPNIWKYFSSPAAESFQFPDSSEMTEEPQEETAPEPVDSMEDALSQDPEDLAEESPEEEDEQPVNAVAFAQIQAETILADAHREAEELLKAAREEALADAERIREQAKQEGFEQGKAEGIVKGMDEAMAECVRLQEAKNAELGAQVQTFLEKAADRLDNLMDRYREEMRDLAISIAEKVICVSLRSSESVIGRMVENAVDKRKRREWVQIYIAECDVKRLTPIPPSLAAALDALSEHVRIIPMPDDEPGTCLIEMPDEIIDASASTQVQNIRAMLHKIPVTDENGIG